MIGCDNKISLYKASEWSLQNFFNTKNEDIIRAIQEVHNYL